VIRGFLTKPLGPAAFCAVLLAVALILFAIPYPPPGDAKRLVQIERTDARIAIVGPSTIFYTSICDQDTRTVPQMLSDYTGLKVLDMSVGGQPLIDSVDLSALASRSGTITDIVLPIAYPQIDDWSTPPYRKMLFFKAAVPGFSVHAAPDFEAFWSGITGKPRRLENGFTFEGTTYPDYRGLTAKFQTEKDAMRCPEPFTHDLRFTRAYYWWTHIANGTGAQFYDLIGDLGRGLAARGKRLHVVVLPTNRDILASLQPEWPAQVAARQKALVDGLSARGLDVLDLSGQFRAAEFSGQWCACTHLSESGRRHLTQAIAARIGAPVRSGREEPRRVTMLTQTQPPEVRR
jgi:hypothetical protein